MPLKIVLLSFPFPFLHSSFGDLQKEIRQTQKEEREREREREREGAFNL